MDYQNKKDISFIDIYDDEVATYPRAVTYTGTVTTDSSDSKVLIADSNIDGFTTNFVEFGNNVVGFEEIRKGYYLFDGTEIRRVVGVTPSAQAITLDSPFTASYEGLPLKVIKPILLPRVTFENTGNIAGSIYTKTSPTDQTQYGSITLKAGEGYTFDSSTLSAFVIDSTNTTVKLSNAFFFDVTEGGGGGGSETLQQTLALGNESGEYDIVLTPGDRVVTGDNRAGIGKGTVARDGADGGVSQFCAIGYEKNWQAGSDYILDASNLIRVAQYKQSAPSVTDDETKGYKVGSFYVLDNGNTYECTDATTDNAVWILVDSNFFYYTRTFDEAKAEMAAHTLVEGAKYLLTDFQTIYDQTGSNITKTATAEQIVLTATSDSTFSPIAFSLDYPTDVLHYDITIDTTYVNGAPCKGKIFYREDIDANKAPFDFRKVLMYNTNDNTESLFYTGGSNTVNDVASTQAFLNAFGIEFPMSIIYGNTSQNTNNIFGNTYISGDLKQSTNNLFSSSTFTSVTQVSNSSFSGNTFLGAVSQMINMDISNCTITGSSDYCTSSSWTETTFGENVNKCIATNLFNSTIGGRVDRLVNCAILSDTITGRLYWCQNVTVFNSNIAGYFQGVNSLTWSATASNCNVAEIQGVTMFDQRYGFENCTITGNSGTSVFGGIVMQCLVNGKTIDEATYPELFNQSYVKTIYKKPNGDVYYMYLDNTNTWVYTQIL